MRHSFNRLDYDDRCDSGAAGGTAGLPPFQPFVVGEDGEGRGGQANAAWRCSYPCPADNFQFNYAKLLHASYHHGVPLGARVRSGDASPPPPQAAAPKSVCVIGGGIAGTLAARELVRAGYRVDIIEVSNRIGGRTHSWRAPDGHGGAQLTPYEQGAMRLPFFNTKKPKKPGPGPYVGGPYRNTSEGATSLTEFFAQEYRISTAAFPNPGKAPGPIIYEPLEDVGTLVESSPGSPNSFFDITSAPLHGTRLTGSPTGGTAHSSSFENRLSGLRRQVTATGAEASMLHRAHTPEEYERSLSHSAQARCLDMSLQEGSVGSASLSRRLAEMGPGVPSYPGVTTGIFVNSGRGVDLATIYPEAAIPEATVTFMYSWPHDAPHVPMWPYAPSNSSSSSSGGDGGGGGGDGDACFVRFYHRGRLLDGPAMRPPPITLVHAIPDTADCIPTTFGSSDHPDYARNVAAWRAGVRALRTVQYKWTLFSNSFLWCVGGRRYPLHVGGAEVFKDPALGDWRRCLFDNSGTWESYWQDRVMPHYQNVTFYEFAVAGPVLPERRPDGGWRAPAAWLDGNFGGLGMSSAEAQLFYTIGCGDGSWGAFFMNSALWALRALLFGFAAEHQMVLGCLNVEQTAIDATLRPRPDERPQGAPRTTLKDTAGNDFWAPQFAGAASFAECHFFKPLDLAGHGADASLHDLQLAGELGLFTSCKVVGLDRKAPEDIELHFVNTCTGEKATRKCNFVVCTAPVWNVQTDMTLRGFALPMSVPTALGMSHWIRSAKVFVALRAPFWRQGVDDTREGLLPQVLATNTELQDMYGVIAPTGTDPFPTTGGVALLSYTWEDGSQKFMGTDDGALVRMLLARLEQVLAAAGLPSFTPFMLDPELTAPGSFTVWHWSLQPEYHGCAKAYQAGIENLNSALLTFNQTHGAANSLFFCGDAFSLESGWLEPAMRMAVDATLHLISSDASARVASPRGFAFAQHYFNVKPIDASRAQRTAELGCAPPHAAVGPATLRIEHSSVTPAELIPMVAVGEAEHLPKEGAKESGGAGAAVAAPGIYTESTGAPAASSATTTTSLPLSAASSDTDAGQALSRVPTRPKLKSPRAAVQGGGNAARRRSSVQPPPPPSQIRPVASTARGTATKGVAVGGVTRAPASTSSSTTRCRSRSRHDTVAAKVEPLSPLSPRGMKAGPLRQMQIQNAYEQRKKVPPPPQTTTAAPAKEDADPSEGSSVSTPGVSQSPRFGVRGGGRGGGGDDGSASASSPATSPNAPFPPSAPSSQFTRRPQAP